MEIYAFDILNVENKLQDIKYALNILTFAINGLKNFDTLDNNELDSFEYVIDEAEKNIHTVLKSMKPIWLDCNDKKIMLITCMEK